MRYRGRFARRLLLLFFGFMAFIVLASIASYFFGHAPGPPAEGPGWRGGYFWGWGFLIVLGVLFFLAVSRRVRRMAAPVDDLVEAAGRISGGDYSVRVREDG